MRKLFIITTLLLVTGLSFSQSLQKEGIVSIHVWTVNLNPDVTMNQFLEIWDNTFSALIKEVMPEMKPYVIKGIGKNYKFEYAGLISGNLSMNSENIGMKTEALQKNVCQWLKS